MLLPRHKIFSLTFCCALLLSACHESKSGDSEQYHQAKTDLTVLQNSLVWNNQCVQTYDDVIQKSSDAQQTVRALRQHLANSIDLAQFIDHRLLPKLVELSEEAAAIKKRCQSPNYDATGVSIERPDMLEQMLNEWNGTLGLLREQFEHPPIMNKPVVKAQLTGTKVDISTPAGTPFKDCREDFCPELVVIPKGEFLMGGNLKEQEQQQPSPQSRPWELPQHQVTIQQPFAMSAYETTVQQFQAFQKETGWEVRGCRNWEVRNNTFGMYYREDLSPSHVGYEQGPKDPVVCVRREDGQAFAAWLSQKTGQKYRLPTEAEFEYALRGGTTTAFFWGDDLNRTQACQFANVLDQSTVNAIPQVKSWAVFNCNDGYGYTAPVGSFKPNPFGLYDMSANAREWVEDCWHENYVGAPSTDKVWGKENNGECHFPVLRGGSWIYNVPNVRSAYRNAYLSSQARSNMWGFRVVRDI